MSVTTTRRRLVDMGSRISGVQTAYDNIPRKLNAAELPGWVVFPAEATCDTDTLGDQVGLETRVYRLALYLCEVDFDAEGELEIQADPFFDRVRDHFLNRPQLTLDGATEPQNTIYNSKLLGDNGLQIGAYPLTARKQYALIEWRIQIAELIDIAYIG